MTPAQRTVLVSGLPDAVSDGPDPEPCVEVHAADVDELLSWAGRERLTGLLVHALEAGDLAIAGEESTVAELIEGTHRRHLDALRICLAAESAAVETITILRQAGIDAYAFKGVANAHLDYPDPAMRTFNDADLHVRRADFGRAIEVLTRHGYTRTSDPMPGWWERRYARAAELRSPSGVEVDLHAAIATGYFGVVLDHDALRADPVTFDLAGTEVHAFSAPARALIAAYAIVLSRGPGMRLQRDLAQQLRGDATRLEAASALAAEGAVVIRQAIDRTAPPVVPDGMRLRTDPTPSRRAIRALAYADAAHRSGWSADARSELMGLAPVDRARYVLGVAWRTTVRVGR